MPGRSADEVNRLAGLIGDRLISAPTNHGATVSAQDAKEIGLPVKVADSAGSQWQAVWRMWTKYALLNAWRVYEGEYASHVFPWPTSPS